MLFFSLALNVEGLVATVAVCYLLLFSRFSYRKTASICCFFLGGAAVAKWQWVTALPTRDMAELDWQLTSMEALLFVTTLVGILTAGRFLRQERLLIIIVAMTALFAILLFVVRDFLAESLLTWYARIYAFVCLSTPLVYVARQWIAAGAKGPR